MFNPCKMINRHFTANYSNQLRIRPKCMTELDGCIVWNAHNTVLGEEALLIYIVLVCYVKTGRYGKI